MNATNKIEITKAVIQVRCRRCNLPAILEQKPGHLCCHCGHELIEKKVDVTNCPWCNDDTICSVHGAYRQQSKVNR